MNTANLQKKANILESFIKKASRVLLEFEVAQSRWDIENGRFKVYKTAKALMRDVRRKMK
jgi:single-stranded DNA-binding protein